MKKCSNSSKCPFGSVSTPGYCAYHLDKENFDCPMLFENYEISEYYLNNEFKRIKKDEEK